MISLLSTGKHKKNIAAKYLLLTLCICISMVVWLGISDLRADGNDPEPDADEIEEGVNDAQTQRLENLAGHCPSLYSVDHLPV